ncbi:MAG TPA: metalloregulator ArsR/SmtB family transcription factor [Trueperaceae bacterium]
MLQRSASGPVFDALGDSTRRAIVTRLAMGPASVSALAEPLGVTLAAVLQHLQVLERAHLVATEKQGRVRVCRLDESGLDTARRWIDDRRREQERKLDRLAEVLGEEVSREE